MLDPEHTAMPSAAAAGGAAGGGCGGGNAVPVGHLPV